MQKLLALCALLLSSTVWAAPPASNESTSLESILNNSLKVSDFSPSEQKKLLFIKKFYAWLDEAGNPNAPFDVQKLKSFMTPNCVINVNGSEAARGISGIEKYLTQFRSLNQIITTELPFSELFFSKNEKKVLLQYKARYGSANANIQLQGGLQPIQAIVVITFSDSNQIQQIDEVFGLEMNMMQSMPNISMPKMPDISKLQNLINQGP